MGRGGDSSVPMFRLANVPIPLSKLRAPGAGYNHKSLTLGEKYAAPVHSGGIGGAQRPMPKNPDKSRNGIVGNRGKIGRANVGASNRRSTEMPMEVLNATGKVALNTSGLVNAEGTYHNKTRKEHLPGRATKQPGLTEGFRVIQKKIVERELLGPAGVGMVLASKSNLGDVKVDMSIGNPEPTSGRGRQLTTTDKGNGAEASRLDENGTAVPLVKYKVVLESATHKVLGKKYVATETRNADVMQTTGTSAALPPKVPLRAQPFKVDKKNLKDEILAKQRAARDNKPPQKWKLGPISIIPDLRGQRSNYRICVQPVECLTEALQQKEKMSGMGVSGKELLVKLAHWVEGKSGNFAKVFRMFDEDHNGTVSVDEFKRGLDMMGFTPNATEFGSLMKIIDKDGSGEIDYEEFASRLTKQLGDDDRPSTASDSMRTPSEMSARPSTADGSGRMKYEVLYHPDSSAKRPQSAPMPHGITQGSWLSRNKEALGVVDKTVREATEWKGNEKLVPVRKAFDTEKEIDNRWSFEALRDVDTQIEYAQLRVPPELDKKYSPAIEKAGVGQLYGKLTQMAPKVADAFIKYDEDRTGTFDRKEFKDVLYSLNVPMTDAQVERVFQTFDKNNDNVVSWSEFTREIDDKKKKWSPRGQYASFSTQGAPPVRIPKAVQLLPKTDVEPLVTHAPHPQTWTTGGEQPPYSALNSAQMARHVKAAEEFGTTTAYHVTKDGIHPGSSIDFYERETRWVERYQTAEKEQKKDRSRARNDRTQASMSRIVVAYDEQNRRAEAKVQRRQGSFRRQKQRYNRRMRAMDPWNNAQIRDFHGQDTSSAMWAAVDEGDPSMQGVRLADPEQSVTGQVDAFGLEVEYGEVGNLVKKRQNAAERQANELRKDIGGAAWSRRVHA